MDGAVSAASDFSRTYWHILAPAATIVIVLVVYWRVVNRQSDPFLQPTSETELRFRNVFAMMTEDRRQSLITYYAQKHECDREEAMKRAMDDRAIDEGRW